MQVRHKRGGRGARAPHFLTDQLTLSQPGGTLSPPSITCPPPTGFSDLATALYMFQYFADFRAYIGKFPSWKEKVTSRAELKIIQLELRLEPARLRLIPNTYP